VRIAWDFGLQLRRGMKLLPLVALLAATPAAAATVDYAFAYSDKASGFNPSYSYNSTGGAISVAHSGTGSYVVTLAGINPAGNAQAHAHGSSDRCRTTAWLNNGGGTNVYVACTTAGGTPVDTTFVVHYYHASGTDSQETAYLWADQPTKASYQPSLPYSYNSTGGTNTIAHGVAPGDYLVYLPGLVNLGGNAHVTAYGGGSGYCKLGGWYQLPSGTYVNVLCFDGNGDPADTRFSLRYTNGHLPDTGAFRGAYMLGRGDWGPSLPIVDYTADATYAFHTGGLAIPVENGPVYAIATIPAVRLPVPAPSSVLVTAVSHDNIYCSSAGWNATGSDAIAPDVSCFDPTGTAVGGNYALVLLTSGSR
jgi:hypothetical protein